MSHLVKYMAAVTNMFGRYNLVATFCNDSKDPKKNDYQKHVEEIMEKASAKLTPNRRIKLMTPENNYDLHVMADILENTPKNWLCFS